MKEFHGIAVIPTVEISEAAIHLLNYAAEGRRLANGTPGHDRMDGAYGCMFDAWRSIIQKYFCDIYLEKYGQSAAEWMETESGSWDHMGTWGDICHYLGDEIGWISIIVEN